MRTVRREISSRPVRQWSAQVIRINMARRIWFRNRPFREAEGDQRFDLIPCLALDLHLTIELRAAQAEGKLRRSRMTHQAIRAAGDEPFAIGQFYARPFFR